MDDNICFGGGRPKRRIVRGNHIAGAERSSIFRNDPLETPGKARLCWTKIRRWQQGRYLVANCANSQPLAGPPVAQGGLSAPSPTVRCELPFAPFKRQNPQQLPAGGSVISAKFRSEVALNADVQGDRILVLEVVARGRLGSRRRQDSRTRELLVEVEVQDFRRERQVLDRGPAGDEAHLRDVEVGLQLKSALGAVMRAAMKVRQISSLAIPSWWT